MLNPGDRQASRERARHHQQRIDRVDPGEGVGRPYQANRAEDPADPVPPSALHDEGTQGRVDQAASNPEDVLDHFEQIGLQRRDILGRERSPRGGGDGVPFVAQREVPEASSCPVAETGLSEGLLQHARSTEAEGSGLPRQWRRQLCTPPDDRNGKREELVVPGSGIDDGGRLS